MADDTTTDTPAVDPNAPEDFAAVAEQIVAGIAKHLTLDDLKAVISAAHLSGKGGELALLFKYGVELAVKLGSLTKESEELFLPLVAGFVAPIVAGLFGSSVDASAFATLAASGQRSAAATAVVDSFAAALTGGVDGEQDPSDAGAKRVAAAAVSATLEGWFQGAATELLLDCIPFADVQLKALTQLPEDIVGALGVGRLVRRAFTPLINATATTPMTWFANKKYAPKLLAEATAIKAFLRGRWSWDDAAEELARTGYNDTRQEELLNDLKKFQAIDDLAHLVWLGLVAFDDAAQTMRDQGFDDEQAQRHFNVRKIEREETTTHDVVTDAMTAYVDGRISESDRDAAISQFVMSPNERQLLAQAAGVRRTLGVKQLTSAQVETAVIAKVLSFADYRDALTRENYSSDAIDVLDILLRQKVTGQQDAAQHKADIANEKAAAAQTKAAAAAQKKSEIDAARQLKAQGSIAELEHAAVIGLIPISRLEQILDPQFTADTVQIYVDDVTQKKAAYDALQQKKADAATRAANKGLPIATLEQAVYDGVLTVDTVAATLKQRGMTDDDIAVLSQVISAKKADLDAAKAKRAEADQRATAKKISLTRAEALVLLGHWTMAQYQSLLQSLGFDDAAVAGMVQLLQDKVDARAQGATIRAGVAAGSAPKGLSLEQFRKAVIAGTKTLDDFTAYLQQQGYTADAAAVLRDELSADVDGAQAAQLRRQQGDTTGGAVVVKLSTAQKAARLGVITPAAYQQRLAAGGYSQDDVSLEMDLLTAEMSGTKSAQQKAATVPASPASKGLTLSQLATAVKSGAATLGEWQAAARAGGLSDDAIATMTAALSDALAVKSDAKSAHDNAVAKLAAQGVSLSDLEQEVRDGSLTIVALEQQLTGDRKSVV